MTRPEKGKAFSWRTGEAKPGILRKAASFASAMLELAVNGPVPDEVARGRQDVCAACPLNVMRLGADWCEACGCAIAVKTLVATERCPAFKWPLHYSKTRRPIANPIRHLAYHVYAIGDAWRMNVDELSRRWSLFNGSKRVAIATDCSTAPAEEVQAAFPSDDITWIMVKNNPKVREVATFRQLHVDAPAGKADVTFCGHTKGSQYGGGLTWRWAREMYRLCLDDWGSVHRHLEAFPIAGAFKRYGQFREPGSHRWHFSGTFYWVRNREVFAMPDWDSLTQDFYGTESWPGLRWPAHEAGCLFGDNVANLYSQSEWDRLANDFQIYDEARRGTN